VSDCNHCMLNRIRKTARSRGDRIVTRKGKNFGLGDGVDVYSVPKDVEIDKGEKPLERYKAAWFMRIPNGCECD
jgi:hypothetical protein